MGRLLHLFRDALESVTRFLRSTREAYEGATQFARMRIWVFAVLAVDLIMVVSVIAVTGTRVLALEVWYQPSFPANLLIVRNDGSSIREVSVLLDGRYRIGGRNLAPGVNGFEVERQFRDEKGERPPLGYRPSLVTVHARGETMEVSVKTHGQ